MSPESPLQGLDRDLVYRFFSQFAMLECALKREGYVREGVNGAAQPNWGRFAGQVRGRLRRVHDPVTRAAVDYLMLEPPRPQICRDGELVWVPIVRESYETDERHLLALLRAVRNNLFHGGKYSTASIDAVERNRRLIEAALCVLELCYEWRPELTRWRQVA